MHYRYCGSANRPVLLFLHGFPEAAFIWDDYLEYFSREENGGFFCLAPNLRGYAGSYSPPEVEHYRQKWVLQDILDFIHSLSAKVAVLVAHDWGGAVAWHLANQYPSLLEHLLMINSPHPGLFLKALQTDSAQQKASLYMNFLSRPDAPQLLRADHYRRALNMLAASDSQASDSVEAQLGASSAQHWLTEDLIAQYRALWDQSLPTMLHYYTATPVRPPVNAEALAELQKITLPKDRLTVDVPTTVIWGLLDQALLAKGLLDGLEDYIPQLTIHRLPHCSHWVSHEAPVFVKSILSQIIKNSR
ncbi:MAG: alpha/beta hydrolase [Gammaproteobacteria bacterium]|nr:alpha/beta hydrolase [Gammaproteobacteria bacterium]